MDNSKDNSVYRTRNGNEPPKVQGDYFIIMRHENDEPEEANTNAECEFIPGHDWPVAEGWTVLYWLEKVEEDQQELWDDLVKYLNHYNSQNQSGQMFFPVFNLKSKYHLIKK